MATLTCALASVAPATAYAADRPGAGAKQAAIERTWRTGSGLLWGGVASSGAGALTFLALVPTQRDLRLARSRVSLCMLSAPSCPEQDAEVERRLANRNAVAITGSILTAAGVTLIGLGVWKRRTARRQQEDLDRRTQPEWSLRPSFGRTHAELAVHVRF